MARVNVDVTGVEASDGTGGPRQDPIPEGRYILQAIETGEKANSKNTGRLIEIVFEVYEGKYKGRKIYERWSYKHENVQTQEIAQRDMAAFCDAAGLPRSFEDTTELEGHPFYADVRIDPGRSYGGKDYGPSNAIQKYVIDADDEPPAEKAPAKPAPEPTPAAAPAKAKRPWENRGK